MFSSYGWWKESCTSWYGKYLIIFAVLYIPGGAGFLVLTVCFQDTSILFGFFSRFFLSWRGFSCQLGKLVSFRVQTSETWNPLEISPIGIFFSENLETTHFSIFSVVVSIFFDVHPYLGKWSNLTNIFQMGWNHQKLWGFYGGSVEWLGCPWEKMCSYMDTTRFIGDYTRKRHSDCSKPLRGSLRSNQYSP